MSSLPGDELQELSERQDPRLLRSLDVVAPGGALREGIDNIVHARTGGLIVVGDPSDISHLLSGGIKLDIDYTPAMLYQVAKMDGAIVLNCEATKIAWANVQLMPDPTILSSETGTRHRTAERVSKQTDALVIAISQRRDVVSLYVEGTKYILQDIPAVLAKANQGLATLEKYRERLDQVATRLTVLEFEGGGVLYDALSVLQRAELVTRMAVEVERYIVELGTEGRLIEMQLEETMVGVAAEKTALIRDYSVEDSEQNLDDGPGVARAAAARGRARLRPPRRAARLRPQAQHARLPGRPARLPRARPHPADSQACRPEDHPGARRPRGGPRGLRRRPRGCRRSRPDPGQGHPRGAAAAPGGRSGRPVLAELTARGPSKIEQKEQAIPELEEAVEVTSRRTSFTSATSRRGTRSSIPITELAS